MRGIGVMFPASFSSPLSVAMGYSIPEPMDATAVAGPPTTSSQGVFTGLPYRVGDGLARSDTYGTRYQPRVGHTFVVYKQPKPDTNFYPGAFLFSRCDPARMRDEPQTYFLRSVSALNHYLFSNASINDRECNTDDANDLLKVWSPVGFQIDDPESKYSSEPRAIMSVSLSHHSPLVPNIWLAAKPELTDGDWLWFVIKKCKTIAIAGNVERKFWAICPHVERIKRAPSAECYTELRADGAVLSTGAAIPVGMVHQRYNMTNRDQETFQSVAKDLVFPVDLGLMYAKLEQGALELPLVEVCRLLQ